MRSGCTTKIRSWNRGAVLERHVGIGLHSRFHTTIYSGAFDASGRVFFLGGSDFPKSKEKKRVIHSVDEKKWFLAKTFPTRKDTFQWVT